MHRLTYLILLFAVTVGCSQGTVVEVFTVPDSTVPATSVPVEPDQCGAPGQFTEAGVVASIANPGSDSSTIGEISWDQVGGCERFHIEFQSSEGAPATSPPMVRAEFIPGMAILRVTLGSTESVIIDQAVDSDLVNHLYVVDAYDSGMFIDFHLSSPALARVVALATPAEVTVELRPGIVDPTFHPSVSDRLVITSPQEGSQVSPPIRVGGYSRQFEEGVLVIATSGTTILHEELIPASSAGWSEFRTSLQLQPGPVLVFIGEDQPGPSGLAGVIIPVTVE